jgi:hypothetical protein
VEAYVRAMRAQIEEAGRRRQEYIRANRTPMDSPSWSEKCARKSRCDSHINNTGTLYALSVWVRLLLSALPAASPPVSLQYSRVMYQQLLISSLSMMYKHR